MAKHKYPDTETETQVTVGIKIRELRQSMALSAVELSRLTGISQGHLSKIENGRATLSIKVLSQLCQFFQRPLSYIFQQREELPQILGTLNVGDGPEDEGFKWFVKEVSRVTDNRISVVSLEPYQLGTVKNIVEYLDKGIVDLFIDDLCNLDHFVNDFNIFALPYVFPTIDQERTFLTGSFFKENLQKPLLEKGIRFINTKWNWLRGVRRVLVAKRPIFSPADVRGLRVRIFESEVLKQYWKNLGAYPVVIPWEETNMALRDDEIDVMPCYKALLYPSKFCQYAKYVTEIGDISSILCVVMNEAKYQLLTPSIQSSIEDACSRAGDMYSSLVKEMDHNDESLNIKEFNAAYISVDNSPWKNVSAKTRQDLIRSGVISNEIHMAVEAG